VDGSGFCLGVCGGHYLEKREFEMPPKEVPQKKGKRQVQGAGRAAPAAPAKKVKVANPLFQAKPKNWRVGGDLRVWNSSYQTL
jgi:hypothetical protein